MDNKARNLLCRYYVRLKAVHINWTHKTVPKRGKEAYILAEEMDMIRI